MFDRTTFPKDMLTSPSKIALSMIGALSDSLDDNQSIPNAMNGVSILWSAAAGVFSSIVHDLDSQYATLYPKRSRTPAQLFPHLSKYDYVNLQASPATLMMAFGIRRDEILANAVDLDDVYAQIVIPKTSQFYIGSIPVSFFHDIVIKLNKNTGVINVMYDTSEESPFETLGSNMMENPPVAYRQNMLDYILFGFKTSQFTRKVYPKTISSQEGFAFVFAFSNNYFAAEIFSVGANGVKTPLEQCFDTQYYDPAVPTAILTLDTVAKTVTVVIPQIYLEKNLVSSQIEAVIYDTLGELAYNIPPGDAGNVQASFDSGSSIYSAPLEKLTSYILHPLQQTMVGGSSPKSFDVIKDGVINQSFYDRIPITPAELTAKAKSVGYQLTEIVDDITNRVFFASNALEDTDGTLLPVLSGKIHLADAALAGNPGTILKYVDQSVVILPTTIFELGETGAVCTPVPDEKLTYLGSLTKEALVAEMNTTTYLRQPFHIALSPDKVYPTARPYNLLTPTTDALTYVKENENSDKQMTVTAVEIAHLVNGTGGFEIRLAVLLTESLKGVDVSNLRLVMTFPTATNSRVYVTGTVISVTTDSNVVFSVKLDTTYHIDESDNITITATDWNGQDTTSLIALSTEAYILLFVTTPGDDSVDPDSTILPNVPTVLRSQLCVAMQSVVVTLGKNLERSIYSEVNTTWGNDVYQTYTETEYQTAATPVYQRDPNGDIIVRPITDSTGQLALDYVTLYQSGELLRKELDISTTLSLGTGIGLNKITVADATGILRGMLVTCQGLPYGVIVKDIQGTIITLSIDLTTALAKGITVIFSNQRLMLKTTADQDSTTMDRLPVGQTGGIYPGQSVFGFDIPAGAVVLAILDQSTIQLSVPTTTVVKSGTYVTFLNKTAAAIAYRNAGDTVLDDLGQPIIIKDRQNEYLIPAVLFDGRLYQSDDIADQTMVKKIPAMLNDYAAGISAINLGFAEQRDVYYQPSRTIGTADFDTGNGVIQNLGLEMGLVATFYLPESLYGNDTIRESLKAQTVQQFTKILGENIISVFELGSTLKELVGDQITGVAISGLNGDVSLMVTSLTETGCRPSVRKILYVRDDGVVARKPDITYIFKSSTDGT